MGSILILIVVLLIGQPSLLPLMLVFLLVGVPSPAMLGQGPERATLEAASGQGIVARAEAAVCARTDAPAACAMLQASPKPGPAAQPD